MFNKNRKQCPSCGKVFFSKNYKNKCHRCGLFFECAGSYEPVAEYEGSFNPFKWILYLILGLVGFAGFCMYWQIVIPIWIVIGIVWGYGKLNRWTEKP
jgi:hypothetical protein